MATVARLIILDVAFALIAFSAAAQESKDTKKNSLYASALVASLDEMEKSWGRIDDSNGGSGIRTDYRHMPVVKDPEITDALASQFGDHQVEYLDNQAQIDRYKSLRKNFSILKIHPVQIDGEHLKITVSVYYVEYEKRKLRLALSDWSEVEFHFDCEQQRYAISSVKLGGI